MSFTKMFSPSNKVYAGKESHPSSAKAATNSRTWNKEWIHNSSSVLTPGPFPLPTVKKNRGNNLICLYLKIFKSVFQSLNGSYAFFMLLLFSCQKGLQFFSLKWEGKMNWPSVWDRVNIYFENVNGNYAGDWLERVSNLVDFITRTSTL